VGIPIEKNDGKREVKKPGMGKRVKEKRGDRSGKETKGKRDSKRMSERSE